MVNDMTKRGTRKSRYQAASAGDLRQMVDIVLAFDRAVVEYSMEIYNIHWRDRAAIREQNRRLHGALRDRILVGSCSRRASAVEVHS